MSSSVGTLIGVEQREQHYRYAHPAGERQRQNHREQPDAGDRLAFQAVSDGSSTCFSPSSSRRADIVQAGCQERPSNMEPGCQRDDLVRRMHEQPVQPQLQQGKYLARKQAGKPAL